MGVKYTKVEGRRAECPCSITTGKGVLWDYPDDKYRHFQTLCGACADEMFGDINMFKLPVLTSEQITEIRPNDVEEGQGMRVSKPGYTGGELSVNSTEAKTHVIDGVTYVEVARKAKVGEKVVVVNPTDANDYGFGDVFVVEGVDDGGVDFRDNVNQGNTLYHSEYRVLEAVSEALTLEETIEEPRTDRDMLVSLAQRITRMEKRYDSEINTLYRNIQALAEELEAVKHERKPSGAKLLADAFEALAKHERGAGK